MRSGLNKYYLLTAAMLGLLILPVLGQAQSIHYPDTIIAQAGGGFSTNIIAVGTTLDTAEITGIVNATAGLAVDTLTAYFVITLSGTLTNAGASGSVDIHIELDAVVFDITIYVDIALVGDDYILLSMDRSGSMHAHVNNDSSRWDRAVAAVHEDAESFPAGANIKLFFWDEASFEYRPVTGWTNDTGYIMTIVDSIPGFGHYTPLADAMCIGADTLSEQIGTRTMYTYTDGYELTSDCNYGPSSTCAACIPLCNTGWNYDCDPTDPTTCTAWQMCVASAITSRAIVMVRYFGETFKGTITEDFYTSQPMSETSFKGTPDMSWLQYIAEKSGGQFQFIPDEGGTPTPAMNGDVDCNGIVNIQDIMYLIHYLYMGGAAPCSF